MAKERTINEIRQTKEYYTGNEHQKYAEKANNSEEMKQNRCPLDPVEEAKILIVDKITRHLSDVIFEKVLPLSSTRLQNSRQESGQCKGSGTSFRSIWHDPNGH